MPIGVRAFLAVETARPLGSGGPEGDQRTPSHLTLRFFEVLDGPDLDRVVSAVPDAVADLSPFDLALGGIGAFPSRGRPRVVWLGVTTGADEVRVLAARVRDALARAGLDRDREEFVPHVTLFRVRGPRDRDRAAALLEGRVPSPVAPPFRVTEIVLKESRLTALGAEHRTLRAFPLGVVRRA